MEGRSGLHLTQVEGNSLEGLAISFVGASLTPFTVPVAIIILFSSRYLNLLRHVLPLRLRSVRFYAIPVDIVTRRSVALSVEACFLSCHVVELNVNLVTSGDILIRLDEELSIPVSSRIIWSIDNETASAILTSTVHDSSKHRITTVLLRVEVDILFASQVAVRDYAVPALGSCCQLFISNCSVNEVDVATVGVLDNYVNSIASRYLPSLLCVSLRSSYSIAFRISQLCLAYEQLYATGVSILV